MSQYRLIRATARHTLDQFPDLDIRRLLYVRALVDSGRLSEWPVEVAAQV